MGRAQLTPSENLYPHLALAVFSSEEGSPADYSHSIDVAPGAMGRATATQRGRTRALPACPPD